jgi:hypothetical protein
LERRFISFLQQVFDTNKTKYWFSFSFSQVILLHIIDNESYEKDAVFYVELGEPVREEGMKFYSLVK